MNNSDAAFSYHRTERRGWYFFLALKQWQDCNKMTYQVPLELQYLSFGNEKNTLKHKHRQSTQYRCENNLHRTSENISKTKVWMRCTFSWWLWGKKETNFSVSLTSKMQISIKRQIKFVVNFQQWQCVESLILVCIKTTVMTDSLL